MDNSGNDFAKALLSLQDSLEKLQSTFKDLPNDVKSKIPTAMNDLNIVTNSLKTGNTDALNDILKRYAYKNK